MNQSVTLDPVAEATREGRTDSTFGGRSDADLALELRILSALRRIIQAVDIHSRRLASKAKITTPQLVTLLCVARSGPVTPSDLAHAVHLSNSTVVGILDRLEAKKLLYREHGTRDRRQVFVTATPEGIELAKSAPSPLQEDFAKALLGLPDVERGAIAESLERIVELMRVKDASPFLDEEV